MPTPSPHLSKSRFTLGLQCHRALWWRVHEPDSPEFATDLETQAILDQGTRVGEIARAYVPGGTLIDEPYWALDARIAATRAAIAGGARVIYEASFRADGVFVSVDILHRGRRGWTLAEVKSTTKVKAVHVPDVAVQAHVVRRSGVDVRRAEVMHLNRGCYYPDLSNLFTRAEVTEDVGDYLPTVPREIKRQLTVLARSTAPEVEPGDHCTKPYDCQFFERCHGPVDTRTPRGRPVIAPGLREALAPLKRPIAHLDFETIASAIPVWPGCRPYDPVPVQFSVHVEPKAAPGRARHAEWLADGPADPRPALARALVDALGDAGSIVVYHQPFEEARLRELQDAVPKLAGALGGIIDRLVDLLPIVRAHIDHPAFEGRYGLKKVAPALVPSARYDAMEIGDGAAASRTLEAMLLGPALRTAEKRKTRAALLAYCAQDTASTMGVLARLRELAKEVGHA